MKIEKPIVFQNLQITSIIFALHFFEKLAQ